MPRTASLAHAGTVVNNLNNVNIVSENIRSANRNIHVREQRPHLPFW